MSPNTRNAVLVMALIFCVVFGGLMAAVTHPFFWPPRTFGELLADAFSAAGLGVLLMIMLAIYGALKNPPPK